MSHTPEHSPEAKPEVVQPIGQPSDSKLQQQASQLLTNPEANQGRVDQQAGQLLAQGLKDISGKNETYGILELMKGASQKPELVQDQGFIEGLKQAVGDVHPHLQCPFGTLKFSETFRSFLRFNLPPYVMPELFATELSEADYIDYGSFCNLEKIQWTDVFEVAPCTT